MRDIISYLLVVMLIMVFGACSDDAIVNLQEEGSAIVNSAYISCNTVTMSGVRGLNPPKIGNNEETALDSKGEKGRDRRENNSDWYDGFDAEAPLARLQLVNQDPLSGDMQVKFVFGSYVKEVIMDALEGRMIELHFYDSDDRWIDLVRCDCYHIGDTFVIPSSCHVGCKTVQILAGFTIPNGAHFTYNGIQLFITLLSDEK